MDIHRQEDRSITSLGHLTSLARNVRSLIHHGKSKLVSKHHQLRNRFYSRLCKGHMDRTIDF